MKQNFRRIVIKYGMALGMGAALSLVPGLVVAADAPATNTAAQNAAAAQKPVSGTFVSFEGGMLSLALQNTGAVVPIKIPENATTVMWHHDEGRLKPVDTTEAMSQLKALVAPPGTLGASHTDTAETMSWRKAGTAVVVQNTGDNVTIRIGENKVPYVGNFMSFKDDQLLFQLKNPTPGFQKTYGGIAKFRMNENIPVYQSIDGGEYQRAGTPRTVFSTLKEGAVVTVYHHYKTETDEFYLVLVGVK